MVDQPDDTAAHAFDEATADKLLAMLSWWDSQVLVNPHGTSKQSPRPAAMVIGFATGRDADTPHKTAGWNQAVRGTDGKFKELDGGLNSEDVGESREFSNSPGFTVGPEPDAAVPMMFLKVPVPGGETVETNEEWVHFAPPQVFWVDVTEDGTGVSGGTATECTFKYDVKSPDGSTILASATPQADQRDTIGKMVAGTLGLAYVDAGVLKLFWVNEHLDLTTECPA